MAWIKVGGKVLTHGIEEWGGEELTHGIDQS